MQPNGGKGEPKRGKQRVDHKELICAKSTANIVGSKRPIPNTANNETKQGELRAGHEVSGRNGSKTDHELSMRAQPHGGRDGPKQMGERDKEHGPVCTD